MYAYLVAFMAAIVIGLHIMSLRMISSSSAFYTLFVIMIFTLVISRFLIYEAMRNTENPTNVHVILNFSILITFIISYYVLRIRNHNYKLFIIGLSFVIFGFALMNIAQGK